MTNKERAELIQSAIGDYRAARESGDAHGNAVEVAQFVGIDGYNLFTDPARLGTFLPDVASDGQEITRF